MDLQYKVGFVPPVTMMTKQDGDPTWNSRICVACSSHLSDLSSVKPLDGIVNKNNFEHMTLFFTVSCLVEGFLIIFGYLNLRSLFKIVVLKAGLLIE